jgi:hypothetical protein
MTETDKERLRREKQEAVARDAEKRATKPSRNIRPLPKDEEPPTPLFPVPANGEHEELPPLDVNDRKARVTITFAEDMTKVDRVDWDPRLSPLGVDRGLMIAQHMVHDRLMGFLGEALASKAQDEETGVANNG